MGSVLVATEEHLFIVIHLILRTSIFLKDSTFKFMMKIYSKSDVIRKMSVFDYAKV